MIAVVGDAGVDRTYQIECLRLGSVQIAEGLEIRPAGGSANTAAHAAAAGARVTLFAGVGRDEAASLVRRACEQLPGLRTRLQEWDTPTQCSVVLVERERDGERTIVIERPAQGLTLLEDDKEILGSAEVVFINLENADERRSWVNSTAGYRFLPIAHLPEEAVAGRHWDAVIGSLDDHVRPSSDALNGVTAEFCLMTDGSAGGAIWTAANRTWSRWSSPSLDVVDVVGAGDAFLGGVLAAAVDSWDVKVLVEAGVRRAQACLRVPGAWPR